MPRLDKLHGNLRLHLRHQRLAVESDAGGRVLRGQADGQHQLRAVADHLADSVGDKGFPVAHTHVDGKPQFPLQRGALGQGDLGQGRLADQ